MEDAAARANRAAQLAALKHHRLDSSSRPAMPSSSLLSPGPAPVSSRTSFAAPPAQSRDASAPIHSGGLNSAPSTPLTGRVLVPNSSPIAPSSPISEPSTTPLQLNGPTWSPPPTIQTTSNYVSSAKARDPLMASTMSVGQNKFAQFAYNAQGGNRGVGRPQTPAAQPSTTSSINEETLASPESPEIIRAGARKRKRHVSEDDNDGVDGRSDDSSSSPDTSKSRLTKGRPAPTSSGDDVAYKRFYFSNPMHDEFRKKGAWAEAKGDEIIASRLLETPSWKPPLPKAMVKSKASTRLPDHTDKAATREKLKQQSLKSAIYAQRKQLTQKNEGSSSSPPRPTAPSPPPTPPQPRPRQKPSLQSPTLDLTQPSSPLTPLVAPSKKAKKMVVSSDSEAAVSDEEEEASVPMTISDKWKTTLAYFNDSTTQTLQELTGCTTEQTQLIISLKPFSSMEDLNSKLGQGRKKAGPGGISPRLVEESAKILVGYGKVDALLTQFEATGKELQKIFQSWTSVADDHAEEKTDGKKVEMDPSADEGGLHFTKMSALKKHQKGFIPKQPTMLPAGIQLKEYQLLGLNWLNLLYSRDHSCILADEMGLGKTIQVISFFAHLKERGKKGPHLVIVPASTLENWCREFNKFAPDISVQTYYAGKNERPQLQRELSENQKQYSEDRWEVLITTYTLAQAEGDRRFLRKFNWDCCVFDEGHVLKNSQSQRYQQLIRIPSNWKLLLTGTPLQNNLQELVSLLNFVLPDKFEDIDEDFMAIFKVKGDSKALLARERIIRAKKMLTPFILRRRKDQVLQELPKKKEYVEYCEMNNLQRSIYSDAVQRSRRMVKELASVSLRSDAAASGPTKKKAKSSSVENSTNVLMDLRKASSHPMLFRTRFTDEVLGAMAKRLIKEPDFRARGALFDLVKEDMTVMTDSELQVFCRQYKSLHKFSQEETCFEDSGKTQTLLKLIQQYTSQGRKLLVFSQFTQILDILQVVLERRGIKFLVLTGSTPVDARQSLVDEFGEDDSIPVFLLSTKAGGMGINLTAASVVILFDQDFNPHNDRQAQDRAYRIGQKRDVDVIKLISTGTIEEDMLRLGQTKLALDQAVAGEDGKAGVVAEEEMRVSLLTVLRQKFEGDEGGKGKSTNATSSEMSAAPQDDVTMKDPTS